MWFLKIIFRFLLFAEFKTPTTFQVLIQLYKTNKNIFNPIKSSLNICIVSSRYYIWKDWFSNTSKKLYVLTFHITSFSSFLKDFCLFWQNFYFGTRTKHHEKILWNFEIFLNFSNLLRSLMFSRFETWDNSHKPVYN